MAVVRIEWLYATHECEYCGMSGADGAAVTADGHDLLDLTPHAACFDDVSFDDETVYVRIGEALGIAMPRVDEDADDYVYDPSRYADAIREAGHEIVEVDRARV